MISARAVELIDVYLRGREAALLFDRGRYHDQHQLCPYPLETERRQVWVRGFRHGRWELERVRRTLLSTH